MDKLVACQKTNLSWIRRTELIRTLNRAVRGLYRTWSHILMGWKATEFRLPFLVLQLVWPWKHTLLLATSSPTMRIQTILWKWVTFLSALLTRSKTSKETSNTFWPITPRKMKILMNSKTTLRAMTPKAKVGVERDFTQNLYPSITVGNAQTKLSLQKAQAKLEL